jgi:glycosyltransferase involved in cell wall biosynthesis
MASTVQPAAPRVHVLEIIGNAIVGGMENSVLRLIDGLAPERFAVSALCPFESPYTDRLRAAGAEVHVAPMPDDPPWSAILLASTLVKANAVDVIHAHLPNAHVLAGVTGRLTGKPVLATIHGRQLTTLDLEVHRSAGTHLHVVCKQSHFHALGIGVTASQLHFIAHGVDTDVFKPHRRAGGALRRRFGIADDAPVVGFVGRLSPEKGPDVFLRMALGVRERNPAARFIVAGDGPMRHHLDAFIRQFDLDGVVHLAGMQSDMPAVFNELDLLVSASHSEAMPLALMEAMACARAPVVRRQPRRDRAVADTAGAAARRAAPHQHGREQRPARQRRVERRGEVGAGVTAPTQGRSARISSSHPGRARAPSCNGVTRRE